MTEFEKLLLAKGDADLFCAFVIDYPEIISDDFKKLINLFIEKAEKRFIKNKEKVLSSIKGTNDKSMSIKDLLEYHEGDVYMKKRICRVTWREGINTVDELLNSNSKLYMLGPKSKAIIDECLSKIGY